MEKLYVDKWFKLPPKEKLDKPMVIKIEKRKASRKHGKSHRKNH